MNANPLDFLHENYLETPFEVSLETLALCNAACTFCPYPTLERKFTKLSDNTIASLIDQMSEFDRSFAFSPFKVNEPLLDKRLLTILRTVNRRVPQAVLRLFTNGSPLTRETIHEIHALECVEHLWISLNSHEPEEYHRLMGLRMAHTVRNLDTLHDMMMSGQFRHAVTVSKVSKAPEAEFDFRFYCVTRWPLFKVQIIKQDGWLGYVPPSDPRIPDTPCMRWFELSILATGQVSLCCMDGKGEFIIGDINQQSMLDIYNNPKWRTRRELMLSRRSIHPCSTCTY
jgi:sulfatase maturation enzyme AslB (radical SAM superfamily)